MDTLISFTGDSANVYVDVTAPEFTETDDIWTAAQEALDNGGFKGFKIYEMKVEGETEFRFLAEYV